MACASEAALREPFRHPSANHYLQARTTTVAPNSKTGISPKLDGQNILQEEQSHQRLASAYPLAVFVRQDPALSMMFSIYVTLGVFLLLAIRNPQASRTLIAFTAWSSFAHAAVMGTQALRNMISRGELVGVAILVALGVAFIALAPSKAAC